MCKKQTTADLLSENAKNQVIIDYENEQLLCPGCRNYVAPLYALKCIDKPVPKFCSECGHKLHSCGGAR